LLKSLFAILLLTTAAALAADPDWYIRKPTWQQTVLVSCEALAELSKKGPTVVTMPDLGIGDFTVAAWIKTEADAGVIFVKGPGRRRARRFQPKILLLNEGRLAYQIGEIGTLDSGGKVNDGRWHHIALVGSNPLEVYVDGRLVKTGTIGTARDVAAESSSYTIILGSAAFVLPDAPTFNGSLDEVRIYNCKLTSRQIADLAAGSSELNRGLFIWWGFEEDGEDRSGNGNEIRLFRVEETSGKVGQAVSFGGDGAAWFSSGRRRTPQDQLWELVARDFDDPDMSKQIEQERQDNIWAQPWQPGDYRELAQRYARATRDVPGLREKARQVAEDASGYDDLIKVREIYYLSIRNEQARAVLQKRVATLRPAIEYLIENYGSKYPKGHQFLSRLEKLEARQADLLAGAVEAAALDALEQQLKNLQYEALVTANPLFDFDKLLFVKRYTYQSSHYYTDFIDGCRNFGGNISILSLKDGKVTDLAPSMAEGIFGRYDLSFDAKRIVFDWKRAQPVGFRIYEIGIDGKGLRQLTFPPPDEKQRIERYDNSFTDAWGGYYNHHTDDMHPCYLPDGGIVFTSSRCEFGTLCDAPDVLASAILYRIDADGSNMQKLTNSSVSEFSPSIMHDGRIIYSRWEYVDKGQIGVKCLWAMRPDGSGSVEIYANDIALPPVFIHSRPIPGYDNSRFVVLGAPHFPQSGVGTVIRLDINHPIRTREPMTYITPNVDIRTEGGFHHKVDGRWVKNPNGPLYMDPYPLSDKFFLVSHNPDKPWNDLRAWGLYLLDEFGNHVLIYKDPEFSCWQPMPVRARKRPHTIPSVLPEAEKKPDEATVVMSDVYVGLEGIERGTIKYLRIMEQVPRPWGARRFWDQENRYNGHTNLISTGPVLGLKVLWGIVPVYEDGSAHFIVPTDRNIYFQALDENFMEVQRMRTYVNFRPGERRSCIGCHELRQLAPANKHILALQHPPSRPGPQPGEAAPRVLHYPTDVQPILDKHCIVCHSGEEAAAGLDLTGEMTTHFSRSYENILARGLVETTDEGSDFEGTEPLPPKTIGSHASKFITVLLKGHQDVKLSAEELIKLTTWVDANAQYYGSYYGRRHIRYKNNPNFRPVPTFAEAISSVPPVWDTEP